MVDVSIRPWASDDLALLQRGNTIEMTAHLAGPETDEEVHARHEKYLRLCCATARILTAFPDENNAASNALCATGGFTLRATHSLPFRGQILRTNV